MNKTTLSTVAVVFASLIGCAAPGEQDNEPSESASIEASAQSLTLAECQTQRDTCYKRNPLFGLFSCPAQYTQCAANATADGVAQEVTAAITATRECTEDYASCVATNPGGVTGCTADQAECVAAVVGVELPPVVDGTAACVDKAVSCIQGSKRVSNLTECAESLTDCAVKQVESVLPPEVTEVIGDANKCRLDLDACVTGAETPAAVAQCGAESATCAAGALGVQLPQVPLDQVADCAESATQCALKVRKVSDVAKCGENLSACAGKVIENTTNVPKPLTCAQKFSACLAKNPFGFFTCSSEAASCED